MEAKKLSDKDIVDILTLAIEKLKEPDDGMCVMIFLSASTLIAEYEIYSQVRFTYHLGTLIPQFTRDNFNKFCRKNNYRGTAKNGYNDFRSGYGVYWYELSPEGLQVRKEFLKSLIEYYKTK